jgi:hypothetical protein
MPVAISKAGANANEPRVAVDSAGDAVAVWERFEGEELVEASAKPAGSAAWAKSVALTKPETGKGEPAGQQVAIDEHGEAVVVWSRANGVHDFVEASQGRVSSSAWQAPATLSGPGGNVEEAPAIGVNADGNAVATWERLSGSDEVIEAASGQAATGSWQPPVQLSASGQEAGESQVALDSQGNAAAAWRRFDGASYIAEAAGLDAAGPRLNALAIPDFTFAGAPTAFSVSALDVWSAVASTSWSFGDGASATGASVTHAYGAPGPYAVTLTSTDAVGNATTASASLRASPLPCACPAIVRPPALHAPKITGARLSVSRFRVSKQSTAISAKVKVPQGTSFQFTLSQAAKLKIEFKHAARGLRSGKRCVAPSAKLRDHHAKHCTRTLSVGTLARANEPPGADKVAFSGRIGSKALPPGAYTAVLSATTGALRSTPVTLALTIVR